MIVPASQPRANPEDGDAGAEPPSSGALDVLTTALPVAAAGLFFDSA